MSKTKIDLKKLIKRTLVGKDLDEIAVQSLRCGISMEELIVVLDGYGVKYTKKDLEAIEKYRKHVIKVTKSPALGF